MKGLPRDGGRSTMRRMRPKPKTIDEHLAALSVDRRDVLEKLRKTIFLATSKGCSYCPFSGGTLATLAADLPGYDETLRSSMSPVGKIVSRDVESGSSAPTSG
jgi:hypothetical protein